MTESNPEQTTADVEKAFEDASMARDLAETQFAKAKARYRMKLVARRAAGEKLTVQDMEAMELIAIDEEQDVREAYLEFIAADSKYRDAKVKWEEAKRAYWDGRPVKR